MVKHQKIMVALSAESMDLKGVHYALAVAGRMKAEVLVLKVDGSPDSRVNADRDWKEEAMLDLINSARQAGLTVSYHVADGPFQDEVLRLVREEGVGLLVLAEEELQLNHWLHQFRSRITSRVIQVKGKNNINYL